MRLDKRRFSVAACALSGVLAMSACGGDGGSDGGGADTVTLRFTHVFEPEHPFQTCGAEPLAEAVSEATDGSVEIEVFPAGELGAEDEHLEALVAGEVDLALNGFAFLADYYPPISVMEAAYAFDDPEHLQSVVDGDIGQELTDGLSEEGGIELLDVWYYGTRHMTGSEPFASPDDLSGVQVRVPDAPLYLTNLEAMGGKPTPVDFAELYVALQQGVVDAQENPIPTIDANAFDEVQDVLSLTGHMVQGQGFVASPQAMERLDDDQKDALTEALAEVTPEVNQCIADQEQEILDEYAESGAMEVFEDVDVEAFQEAGAKVNSEFEDDWGDLYERIRAES